MPAENPSVLEVVYDGYRSGKHMVTIEPYSLWGEKAYGLAKQDDFRFVPGRPEIGSRIQLVVDDATFRRLSKQRDTRGMHRRGRTSWW